MLEQPEKFVNTLLDASFPLETIINLSFPYQKSACLEVIFINWKSESDNMFRKSVRSNQETELVGTCSETLRKQNAK